ncbi:10 kDa chaperonin 2, chloroplastic [Linum grandiflorum]
MASTAFATVRLPVPSLVVNANPSISRARPTLVGSRRTSLRIHAISKKWEPTKVPPFRSSSLCWINFSDNSYQFHPSVDFQVMPQADRVLIRLEELPEKSAGGILLPKSAAKFERYLVGEVVSVGQDAEQVEAGTKVLLSDIHAYAVDLGTDARHCFAKESDLLAVVE